MKHLVDIDETALAQARAELGTSGIKDTVNAALAAAAAARTRANRVDFALATLAQLSLTDAERDAAWR